MDYEKNTNTLILTPEEVLQLKGTILNDVNVQILIKDASELSVKQLDDLRTHYNLTSIKIDDPNQDLSLEQVRPYDVETYRKCRLAIDNLVKGIDLSDKPDKLNRDIRVFCEIVKRLGKQLNFDTGLLEGAKEEREKFKNKIWDELNKTKLTPAEKTMEFFKKLENWSKQGEVTESDISRRNLQGGLLEGKSVCAGYAEIARNVFSCCGMEIIYTGGFPAGDKSRVGHAINEIKLGDTWYICDFTKALNSFTPEQAAEYLLVSEKDYIGEYHYSLNSKYTKPCNETIPAQTVIEMLGWDDKSFLKKIEEGITLKDLFKGKEFLKREKTKRRSSLKWKKVGIKMDIQTQEIYSEVYSLLNLLGEDYINKLPTYLFNMIKKDKKQDYNPEYDITKEIFEQNIKKESLSIIALFHLNYWCNTVAEKEELKRKFKANEEKYQAEIRKKYNPDAVFKKKKENNWVQSDAKKEVALIECKKSIFRKIINKIKKILHIV